MNRLLLIFCAFLLGFTAQAQVEVVLRIDMSGETIDQEGIFLVGSFQDWAWSDRILLEEEESGIYSVTQLLEPGEYEYSFRNGAGNSGKECNGIGNCEEDCFIINRNGDLVRTLVVEENVFRYTLAAFKYNTCEATLPASVEGELDQSRNLSINPNPFTEGTTLAFTNPKNQSFDVLLFDLSGKLIRNFVDLRGTNFEIERSDLPTGLYLLSLRTDKGEVANRKLVVH